jgi:hypothetical protein
MYTPLCQGHINPKHLVAPASEFCMEVPNIFSIITAALFSLYTKMCVSSVEAKQYRGSQITPELWVLSILLLILFGIKRNCLRGGRSQSLYLFIRRMIKQTVVIIEGYHFCQLHTIFYPISCCQSLTPYVEKMIGDHQFRF